MNDTIISTLTTDTLSAMPDSVAVQHINMNMLAPISRIESLSNAPYIGLILIVMVIVILFILAKFRKQHLFLLRNFFTIRNRNMAYDSDNTEWWGNAALWINILLSYTIYLLIFTSLDLNFSFISDPILFITTFLTIALYLGAHWVIFKFLGSVFDRQALAEAYSKSYFTVMGVMGILLLPITIGLIYLPENCQNILLIISYVLMGLAFILIFCKSIQLFYQKIISLFYIILYFCTLEILPILIIRKVVFYWL